MCGTKNGSVRSIDLRYLIALTKQLTLPRSGYHDRSAYPQPSFYNPIPWHAPAVPSSIDKAEKTRKFKAKPYKWNPDKYF
ncbi:coiled-coil domain-containing protein 34-like [Plakobranchus ocellatus]|uniref:Coiled-coil domain-containing protein 34-like n=1 Tax=Plakobranchus ocellatus TaxID=259542 RepID=A0AAV4DW18_9GAST|nr:coiled-coil domain-containing protein 34-like [Plakobranchus ocellatus]